MLLTRLKLEAKVVIFNLFTVVDAQNAPSCQIPIALVYGLMHAPQQRFYTTDGACRLQNVQSSGSLSDETLNQGPV